MDMSQTAIDYFILQLQLILYGGTYFLATLFLCLDHDSNHAEEKGGLKKLRKQGIVDLCSVCAMGAISILALIADSIVACYSDNNKSLCSHTWSGTYRIAFAFFYGLVGISIIGSLQMIRIKIKSACYVDGERRKTYIFAFYCIYLVFVSQFFEKFEKHCGHKNRESSLPVVPLAVVGLFLNMCLELLYENDYDRVLSGSVFQMSTHGQYLLHLFFYVTVFITFEQITRENTFLSVTAVTVASEIFDFAQSLNKKTKAHPENHPKKEEDQTPDTTSNAAPQNFAIDPSNTGVFFRHKRV